MPEFIRVPKSNRFVAETPSVIVPTTPKIVIGPNTIYDEEVVQACERYRDDPLQFVLETFTWSDGEALEDWQREVLETISADVQEDSQPILTYAIASGKGAGKTALMAQLFLWHLACHKGQSQTVATSVTGAQTTSRLWREIRKWRNRWTLRPYFQIQSTRLEYKAIDTWFGVHQTWNIDRPEAFQGTHELYTAFFVDEASAVPDTILETIESGATDNHVIIVYISNPTRATGRFRECFRRFADHWTTWNIDTRNVPQVTRESIARALEECGGDENAASFRRNVAGQFPQEDYDAVIAPWILQQACEREPSGTAERSIVIGVDVARFGTNKTVFVVRGGVRILEILTYAKQELEVTAERLIEVIQRYRKYLYGTYEPDNDIIKSAEQLGYKLSVYCDADGMGIGVVRICALAGYHIHEVHSGEEAFEKTRYANRRAELWYRCRAWLKDIACLDSQASYYKTLHDQLTDIYYKHDGSNRMLIESKDDMLARGVQSPDIADALVYSLMDGVRPKARIMSIMV